MAILIAKYLGNYACCTLVQFDLDKEFYMDSRILTLIAQ